MYEKIQRKSLSTWEWRGMGGVHRRVTESDWMEVGSDVILFQLKTFKNKK